MKNLKQLRILNGLTQSELAALLGVAQSAIACWESCKKYPSGDKLPEIAKALGCSIDELYADAGKAG